MKFRIITLSAALSAMFIAMACGGGAANSNTANVTPSKSSSQANAVINTNSNVVVNANGFSVTYEDANGNAAKPPTAANKPTPAGSPPKGANYLCRDGSYSMGNQDSTACSGHGGVQRPLSNTPPK